MLCEKCKIDKANNEFYFLDGGLGLSTEIYAVCKTCTTHRNESRTVGKYFDGQITAQFYGAKVVISGKKLSDVSKNLENGIAEGSNRMGIQNFLHLFGKKGGLPSSSKQMRKIFGELERSSKLNITYPDEIQSNSFTEGAQKQVIVNAYERNAKARQLCVDTYGYKCTVCGFDFEKIYGKIGREFIHVHHMKPMSEIKEEYVVNPITDLRPVCPNCHAMLHKQNPSYSIEEIQKHINQLK